MFGRKKNKQVAKNTEAGTEATSSSAKSKRATSSKSKSCASKTSGSTKACK